jgi:hypothetical protein
LIAALLSCGDDGIPGAMAGAPATPGLGYPCTNECMPSGLTCFSQGHFAGQCTSLCGSPQSCATFGQLASCFGMAASQCGLSCNGPGTCPPGTACVPIDGQMACKRQ